METNINMDSSIAPLKTDNEDEVLNNSLTSVVLGINKGKSKFVMGFMTTERISDSDGCLIASEFIDNTNS